MVLKYSVVIVTCNRLNLLKECINHVLGQTYPVKEIILVNNNSTDGTNFFLKGLSEQYDFIKVINLEENIGGAGGFYEGIKEVSSDIDYLLIIDDDAIIALDYLEKITEQMEEGILAYSGTVKTDGRIHTMHRRRLRGDILLKRTDVQEKEYQNDFFYYDIATFCGLVVANSLVKKIGLPQKDYFIWNDDFEYSLRIKKYSLIKNINQAVLNHKAKILEGNRICWKSYYSKRNLIDLGKKHSKVPVIFLCYIYSSFIFEMCRCAIFFIFSSNDKNYGKNCFFLLKQVITDSLHHKLGISDSYYPGKEI